MLKDGIEKKNLIIQKDLKIKIKRIKIKIKIQNKFIFNLRVKLKNFNLVTTQKN